MEKLHVKFFRSDADTVESYGSDFNRALDKIVGGSDKWNTSRSHGIAGLGKTKAKIQRHEDGPEIINLLIENLPDYIAAITGLVTLWLNRPKKKKDSTGLRIELGKFTVESPLESLGEARRVIALLRSMAKEGPTQQSSGRAKARR